MIATDILTKLSGVRQNGGSDSWIACCPAHKDHTPSLSISQTPDRVLLCCHAGCTTDSIIAALGLRLSDLFTDTTTAPAVPVHPLGTPTATYIYSAGYHVLRWDTPTGKQIRPRSLANGKWSWTAPKGPRPLYGHARLQQYPDAPVVVVEGEKCCEAAQAALGDSHVCVTWSGGAPAVAKSDWRPLEGRAVTLWADYDKPGHEAMRTVAGLLAGKAKSIRQVLPEPGSDAPDGWDVADLVTGNPTDPGAAVRRYLDAAEAVEQTPQTTTTTSSAGSWTISALSAGRFFSHDPSPWTFLVPGLLAKAIVGFLFGEGGAFKSLAALWLVLIRACAQVHASQLWLGKFPVPFGRSVFFSAEEVDADLHHRVRDITTAITADRPDVPRTAIENAISANCLIVSREQWTSDRELFLVDEDGAATAKIDEIVRIVSEFGADLIILETQSRIAAIDENDNAAGARLVGVLEEIRDRTGATVLCVAHAGKMARQARTDTHGQNGLRGASALLDNARWGLWFRAVPKGDSGHDRIEIVNAKTFRCKRADSFKVDGVYPRLIPVDGVSPDAFDQVVEYIKANPGSTVRKVRAAVPGRGTTIGQAIRDAIDEGLVETREKRLHHVA